MYSPAPILDALVLDMKKEKPFKIQASTLPYILQGRNVIAQAQAGAGKTIAFAIGMLARVDPTLNKLQGVCLTPTRVSTVLCCTVLYCTVPLCTRANILTFSICRSWHVKSRQMRWTS